MLHPGQKRPGCGLFGGASRAQSPALRWPANLWTQVLLQRRLTLDTATVAQLRVRDERPPQPPEPLRPPDSLALPWLAQVGLPLHIDALRWDADRPLRLGPLRARYDYTRPGDAPDAPPEHRLDLQELAWPAKGPVARHIPDLQLSSAHAQLPLKPKVTFVNVHTRGQSFRLARIFRFDL